MKRSRFYYLIVSTILMSLTISLSLYYPENRTLISLSYTLIIFFGISSFLKKRNEILEMKSYMVRYFTDLQITPFVNNLKDFEKKCVFFTKKQRRSYSLKYVQAYIDKGNFDKAKDLLLEIDPIVKNLNRPTRFIYLQCWFDVFNYQMEIDKMNYTLSKMHNIVDREKNQKTKISYIQNYQLCIWKYKIAINEDLNIINSDLIKINKLLVNNPYKKLRIEYLYLLGISNIKNKNFTDGINCLKKLLNICDYNNVYLVRKSNELIKEYESVLETII